MTAGSGLGIDRPERGMSDKPYAHVVNPFAEIR